MKIHEYQAKEIFSKYGIPVERHTLCRTAAGAVAAYKRMGSDRVVIKAQVLTGGRGKAGGVKLVDNTEDTYQEAKNILGMSIKGLPVNQILVSEAVDIAAEYYVSFTIDRNTRSVILMMSASGGMDIEEVARQSPEKIIRYAIDPFIGLPDYLARRFAFSLFPHIEQAGRMAAILQALYKIFMENDASLVEVNPLALTAKGILMAIDAKIVFDDNALYRHPDVLSLFDPTEEEKVEADAKNKGLTFAPKITAGKAGSGLHVHMRIVKDGQNQMLKDGVLSETARKAIAGMMELAPSITAFGNTNPTSYFRLVPHQEAPTNVCWGDRNRSVLVRVPLGWAAKTDMCTLANPLESESHFDTSQKQTVEMRSPDGSADLYQLLAGLAVACRHGFEIEQALDIAKRTYVNVNIHQKENEDKLKALAQLPDSCAASAECLQKQRAVFEQYNVFSPAMIDGIIRKLRSYEDKTLRADMEGKPEEMLELVHKYFHCG